MWYIEITKPDSQATETKYWCFLTLYSSAGLSGSSTVVFLLLGPVVTDGGIVLTSGASHTEVLHWTLGKVCVTSYILVPLKRPENQSTVLIQHTENCSSFHVGTLCFHVLCFTFLFFSTVKNNNILCKYRLIWNKGIHAEMKRISLGCLRSRNIKCSCFHHKPSTIS